jgi:hypothetical protein
MSHVRAAKKRENDRCSWKAGESKSESKYSYSGLSQSEWKVC